VRSWPQFVPHVRPISALPCRAAGAHRALTRTGVRVRARAQAFAHDEAAVAAVVAHEARAAPLLPRRAPPPRAAAMVLTQLLV